MLLGTVFFNIHNKKKPNMKNLKQFIQLLLIFELQNNFDIFMTFTNFAKHFILNNS